MSNNKDDKNATNKPTNSTSNANDANATNLNTTNQQGTNKQASSTQSMHIKKNDSDTISTGTAGSLMFSTCESSSSLWTYEDLVIKNESEVYVDLTKEVAEDIIEYIGNIIDGSGPSNLLTNLRGNILGHVALWASSHMKGTTNMEPLENKQNINQLVSNIKTSVARRLEPSKSQVRFNDANLKINDRDEDTVPSKPSPNTSASGIPKTTGYTTKKPEESKNVPQTKSIVMDKLYNVVNMFKGLFSVNCESKDTKALKDKDKFEDACKNPVAGTSKDTRPSNSRQMIRLYPRDINQQKTTSESELSKSDTQRPKRPRSPKGKRQSKTTLNEKASNDPKSLKSNSKYDTSRPSNLTLSSKTNLAIASSIIQGGLKRGRSFVGLTQLIINDIFKDSTNVKEFINLLCGLKATQDWAKDGKFFFHFSEDLRTFGTLLGQIVGGCVLKGTIVPRSESALRIRKLSLKTDKFEENELLSGFLRAIEMKDGEDSFAQGFQDGIHFFAPGLRRY